MPIPLLLFNVLAVIIILGLIVLRAPVTHWLHKRRDNRQPTLREYAKSILSTLVLQQTATAEIRDVQKTNSGYVAAAAIAEAVRQLRESRHDADEMLRDALHEHTGKIVAAVNSVHEAVLEGQATDGERQANQECTDRFMADTEKMVGLLGQLRDHAERAAEERRAFTPEKIREVMLPVSGGGLALLQKQSEEQLAVLNKIVAQLEKNDQRLSDFVNATRGIMRAINGTGAEDEDLLLEDAKMICDRARQQGIDMTIEDGLKRARATSTYRG